MTEIDASFNTCVPENCLTDNHDMSMLQLLFWNKYSKFERMRGCSCYLIITQYLWKKGWLQVLVSKKQSTLERKKLDLLQLGPQTNDGTTQIYDSKYSFEIPIRLKYK